MNAFSQFFHQMDWQGLLFLLLQVFSVLLCLTVHETCHGLAALALGDPTAKRLHRLSFNPLRHIDPLGALMMLVAGFGWAKPVPVNPGYFKNPKSGMAITALAGLVSNFILAYLALLVRAVLSGLYYLWPGSTLLLWVLDFLYITAYLSVGLGVFNLIPFPPLDGSKVLGAFLPDRTYYTLLRYERYGMILLVVVLWTGILDGPLSVVRNGVFDLLANLSSFPYYLIAHAILG